MRDAGHEQDEEARVVYAVARCAIEERAQRLYAGLSPSRSILRWGRARETEKEIRAAYQTIAEGYLARLRGAVREDNPHRGYTDFWRRHWDRGWMQADQGRGPRFSIVRETKEG